MRRLSAGAGVGCVAVSDLAAWVGGVRLGFSVMLKLVWDELLVFLLCCSYGFLSIPKKHCHKTASL